MRLGKSATDSRRGDGSSLRGRRGLLRRHLPPVPARVLDVGGGPGAYARWLADLGYDVYLVDPVPLHVEQATAAASARSQPFTVAQGDARALAEEARSFDAVLLLGPLYHLIHSEERLAALAEARRVLVDRGVMVAAAISRFASAVDGLARPSPSPGVRIDR